MIDRRTFNRGISSAVAIAAGGSAFPVLAQTGQGDTATDFWREYQSSAEEAQKLGLATPRFSVGVQALDAEAQIPAATDLLENLERSAQVDGKTGADTDHLIERAAELLRRTVSSDRAPSEARQDRSVRSLSLAARPQLSNLKSEYEQLFRTCEIRSEHRSTVNWYVTKLTDPDNRARYEKVAGEVCAPWYFIGIIHAMEAGFNFRGHLHNGDSLKARTVNIPRGLPKTWNPPNSWEESAVDAIQHDRLSGLEDWDLASMLYRWESYNGFRSRTEHNINTPYLWSFSTHYTKGKFVRDNVWSDAAVSKQCGAAVMLHVLVERGLVTNPAA